MPDVPAWLITDDYEDLDLGALKTGKEADVFLLERVAAGRSCLLVHKRYRPLQVTKGVLEAGGFQRARTFTADAIYREGRVIRDARSRRAAAKKTRYGRMVRQGEWHRREFEMLHRAHEAGARVPYPVALTDEGVIMQYIGDRDGAAPRLVQVPSSTEEGSAILADIVESLGRMLEAGLVHADLSAYNVLVWRGEPWIIDLPQGVDVGHHVHALDLLHRDLSNICRFFTRRGVPADADALFARLVSGAWESDV